ncbi:hypothetical protein QQ045_018407 [Rhodiola kirilowii]
MLIYLAVKQVQDKKVKKISSSVMDIPRKLENSTTASPSATVSGRPKRAYAWRYGRSQSSLTIGDGGRPSKGSSSIPPKVPRPESSTVAMCRRTYAKGHDFYINSISINSDCETFLSADDFSINLWNLEISGQTFNIVDLKPTDTDHVSEMIRTAEFHPAHCNILAYGTSKGLIRLNDLRQSPICDRNGTLFAQRGHRSSRNAAMEIASSIADIKFKNDARHMITRDYMSLKLWDINMNSGPIATYMVHENMRYQIKELYDRRLLIDKFECCLSGNGLCAATGSYSYLFKLFDLSPGSTEARTLQASRTPQRINVQEASPWSIQAVERCGLSASHGLDDNGCYYYDTMKLLNLAWHPCQNLIACAAADSLFLYQA